MKARDEFRAFIVFMSLRCYNLCVIYNLKIYVVLQKEKYMNIEEYLKECTLCPHECKVNRIEEKVGRCKAGSKEIGRAHV